MIDCKSTELTSWTNFSKHPSDCIQNIFQGGCLTEDVTKPLSLVLSSTRDRNDVLSFTNEDNHDNHDLLATIAKTYTVCHRYIQDSSEFNEIIERLGRRKKIDLLVMRAHGTTLSQKYAKEAISPYSDRNHFAALQSSLAPDATIMLCSCSNAETCGKDDFASFIHSMAHPQTTIYAASNPFTNIEIQSGTPPRIRFLLSGTDVTYRSGANGYCNNPIDHYNPDEWKLLGLSERLELLHPLVEKGMAYEAAFSVITEVLKITDPAISDLTRKLFEKLLDLFWKRVDKSHVYTDPLISDLARKLFEKLLDLSKKIVDKSQVYEVAIRAAPEATESTDSLTISYLAEKLFDKATERGKVEFLQNDRQQLLGILWAIASRLYREALTIFINPR